MGLVEYTVADGVGTITLARPPVNALNGELIDAIDNAIDLAADPSVRAVVITGAPHFAAGADISGFRAAQANGVSDGLASHLESVVAHLEALEKPTIAAITGYALGGGLELAMGADFRYLGAGAKVGQPEVLLGIIPGAGGTQRLARLVGPQRCLELCYTGRQVGAEEALDLGIADKVVADEDVLTTALADAATFAAGPTRAYAAIKKAVRDGFGRPLEDGLRIEAEGFTDVFGTDDAKAGVEAFLAKEKASFSGS